MNINTRKTHCRLKNQNVEALVVKQIEKEKENDVRKKNHRNVMTIKIRMIHAFNSDKSIKD